MADVDRYGRVRGPLGARLQGVPIDPRPRQWHPPPASRVSSLPYSSLASDRSVPSLEPSAAEDAAAPAARPPIYIPSVPPFTPQYSPHAAHALTQHLFDEPQPYLGSPGSPSEVARPTSVEHGRRRGSNSRAADPSELGPRESSLRAAMVARAEALAQPDWASPSATPPFARRGNEGSRPVSRLASIEPTHDEGDA